MGTAEGLTMDNTLKKIIETGLRAWLRYDTHLADSIHHTVNKAKLLNQKQRRIFEGIAEDYAITGRARKLGRITDPIDEKALADDVDSVMTA